MIPIINIKLYHKTIKIYAFFFSINYILSLEKIKNTKGVLRSRKSDHTMSKRKSQIDNKKLQHITQKGKDRAPINRDEH